MANTPSIKINSSMITDFSTPVTDASNEEKYLKVKNGKIDYASASELVVDAGAAGLDDQVAVIYEKIDAEKAARESADAELYQKYSDEKAARESADNQLMVQLTDMGDSLDEDIVAAETRLNTSISNLRSYVDTQDEYNFDFLMSTIETKEENLSQTLSEYINEIEANLLDSIYTKADITYVDEELAKKADKATTLAGYNIGDAYTKEETDNALALKADKTTVASDLALKADKTTVASDLALKADKTEVNAALEETKTNYTNDIKDASDALVSQINLKADKTYTDTELAKKADITYVDSSSSSTKEEIQAKLDLKADKTELETAVNTINTDMAKKADKATTLAGYGISDAYTKTEVDAKISSVYKYKGVVDTESSLPMTGNVTGDVWNVNDTGSNYVWDGNNWDKLSETIDLTPYLEKTDAQSTYATIESLDASNAEIALLKENIGTVGSTTVLKTDFDALSSRVKTVEDNKAEKTELTTLSQTVDTKASQESLNTLSQTVDGLKTTKADVSVVNTLNETVIGLSSTKADLTSLNETNDRVSGLESTKADLTSLNEVKVSVTNLQTSKADNTALVNVIETVNTKADKTAVDSIQSAVTLLSSDKADKADTYTKTEVDGIVSSNFKYVGSVATKDNLPADVTVVGTVYKVVDTDAKYFWNGTEWDKLSGEIDLSPYLKKEEAETTYAKITYVDSELEEKADIEIVPVINKVSVEEYDELIISGNLKEDEYYLTPDGSETIQYFRPPLFVSHWSDHMLNNVSWLRADNFSWNSGKVYVAAYNKLLEEYNDEASVEQTDGDITYKLTPSSYKIADASQQDSIRIAYESTGKSLYYIIDTENQQFKLPRILNENGLYLYFYVGYYDQELNKQEAMVDLMTIVDSKADKATTLGGYGISNAYTKGEVDIKLDSKADKTNTVAGYGIEDVYTKAEVDAKINGINLNLLNVVYPVGSIYTSVNDVNPTSFIGGTWESIGSGRVLQGATSDQVAGNTVEAGLPNITGGFGSHSATTTTGSFYKGSGLSETISTGQTTTDSIYLDASRSSDIYGNSDTVQPPALLVHFWKRTA